MSVIMALFRRKNREGETNVQDGIYQAAKEAYRKGIAEAEQMQTRAIDHTINHLSCRFRDSSSVGIVYVSREDVRRMTIRMLLDNDFVIPFLSDEYTDGVLKPVAMFFKDKGFIVDLEYDSFKMAKGVTISLQKSDME